MSGPINDIYKMMDEAGLNAGNLSDANKPLHQIVNEIRTELACKLAYYIKPKRLKIKVNSGDGQ